MKMRLLLKGHKIKMSDSTTIFEIYQQCRNGNCAIMNEHISFKTIFNKSGKYQETQMQTDCTDIDGIVKKTYNDFLKRYPQYKYENNLPRTEFRCELNDIYSEFFNAFLDVVRSGDMISGQAQLCSLIKKNMTKQIRNKYLYSDFTLNGNERLDTDDDGEISLCDRVAYNQWFSNLHTQEKGSFLHDIKELHHIISSVSDISSLFPTDAITQTRLIKLLESSEAFYLKNDDWKLKKISDISALISQFGGNLSEERITQSLNQIYNTLIKCAIGYVPCSRKDYANTTSNTCNMLSEKTEQEIYKYYKCKSYTDPQNIKCLSLLTLQVNAVIEILIQHGFSPDKEKIIDICLFDYDEPDYWQFTESRNSKYRIYHYSEKEKPYSYNLKRSKTIEFDELPKCYIIGNCIIYADQSHKELYYLQKENRLFFVAKRDNNYIGYKIKNDLLI